jgi:CTP:molybdopterin cytidylyltransferase MocA
MEALLLAGGKAERLGEAAQGLPKPLVPIAGFPLAEYTVARLVGAGVTRVIVACRAGQEVAFVNALAGFGSGSPTTSAQVPRQRSWSPRCVPRSESSTSRATDGSQASARGRSSSSG